MEATTSSAQQHHNPGSRPPNLPHGAPHGASAAPRFDNQNKPFFFVQPPQSYMPVQGLQWPVPMPYNPYFGYPGLGYGMPIMSPYQTNPYMEPPGYVMPHTHLHLMDYRRLLNPHYYQTMAYHSRRFHYQHNSSSRETTTSEVQTEPLVASHRSDNSAVATDSETLSVFQAQSSDKSRSATSSELMSQASSAQKVDLKEKMPSNGSFVIQTEEVRMECCTTPVGLQLLHAEESAEVSHMVKCDSIVQTHVQKDKIPSLPAEQSQQVCPDILLVGRPGADEKVPALEECKNQTPCFDLQVEPTEMRSENAPSSTDFQFKVVHLPFESKHSDKDGETESFLWSMEETVISARDSPIQNASSESQDETLIAETTEILMLNEEVVADAHMDGQADMDLSLEASRMAMVSKEEEYPLIDALSEEPEHSPLAEVDNAPNFFSSEQSPLSTEDGNQQRPETNTEDQQETSFESLPAYLPSTNWLADFDKLYYCSVMPPAPKKPFRSPSKSVINLPSRRRKLEMESKDHPTLRKPKEKYKSKGKAESRSLSDHEYCLNRSLSENISHNGSKREQLCSTCVENCGPSAGQGADFQSFKRKTASYNQWIDGFLPTCEACKTHTKRRPMRKCSKGDFQHRVIDTEGESSENGSCCTGSKWKLTDTKRPLAPKQNLKKCPVVTNSRLKEKNCLCNEPHLQPRTWERLQHVPQRNTTREMDENCAAPVSLQERWRNQAYMSNRWQTEQFWKSSTPDADGSRTFAGSPLSNKHKKSLTHSQESRRKDARC
ncbi:uncharacterized protein LOC114453937 [Gouania willdenowi]|nr:uncharacterized protein LOC114453937 [Gouania willdenowi]